MNTILNNSIPEPNSGCWLWTGDVMYNGYGRVREGGRTVLAHRLAWSLANGRDVPAGLMVRHKCDVPSCVNPAHLSTGTQKDNMADKKARGRQDRGENHGRAKLTAEQVLAIRADGRPSREVAPEYGVDRFHVNAIRRRRFWSHI